ncbi:MAG: hypothetical protein RL291_1300 [Pseudomonadota bacterium]
MTVLAWAAREASAQTLGAGQRGLTRIAIGSCANQNLPQPIWDTVLKHAPDLFIFGGDNVYGDVLNGVPVTDGERILDAIAQAYAKQAAVPGFIAVREKIPHLAVWDDHDYGRNDGGVEFSKKDGSQKLFADFWKLKADDPRRTRPGVYHAQTFGPPGETTQIILLDTRYFRSPWKRADGPRVPGRGPYVPDADPSKSILGEAQWAWLEAQLKVPADLRLIVSSIEVVADGNTYERWANLPLEQKRLFDLIASTRANRVIFLSGDRHIGALYRETGGTPYPLYEMTASGLTHSWENAPEQASKRLGALYGGKHFGSVDIDWLGRVVTLSLINLEGVPVRSHRIPFAEIERG